MLKELLKELKKAAFSVLPIYILVILLALTGLAPLSGYEILTFSVSTLLAAAGIGLFSFGADRAMTPIGKKVGRGITKQGRIWVLLTVVFIFGFFITAAEPDLAVLRRLGLTLCQGYLFARPSATPGARAGRRSTGTARSSRRWHGRPGNRRAQACPGDGWPAGR